MKPESFKEREGVIFPEGLTEKDKELIIEQCKNQEATSKEQIEGFAAAYKKAKELASDEQQLKELDGERVLGLILELAALIEKRNEKGFRTTEVTLGGRRALLATLIKRVMEKFAEAYAENVFPSADEAYKNFEDVHPFEDGNGRTGDLLWKIYTQRKTGQWPEQLPPDVYSQKKIKREYKSSFGKVEE